MNKRFLSLLLLGLLSGCSTFTLEGDLPKTPDSTTGTGTVHGSLYGFEWAGWQVEKCSNRQGISRVRYHTNGVFLLAAVASFGLYVPQNVTWWCDGAKPDDEDDDVYVPGGSP